MTAEKTYNGWTNYETWNLNLWITNDQGSDSYWREVAQECYDDAEASDLFTRDEQAALDLSERLKDETESTWQDIMDANKIGASVWADLMGAALSEVNWHEIAEQFIDDCDKDEPEAE